MPELHFLRPWWLLAVPLGPLIVWRLRRYLDVGERWRGVCDEHLLPYLLVDQRQSDARWPLRLIAIGLVVASVALAGPAWRRVELPVYRAPVARVVVLDLSRSMDAPDLRPSRLARARFKVADILRRESAEQTGLVVFAGDAFVVSPLTEDAETLVAMLPALETSVMPAQGSRVDLGLEAAGRLLKQGQASRGEVILVTDAGEAAGAPVAAAQLAQAGFPVSVLAVGTRQGAPIPLPAGDFLKDENGSIVVPGLSLAPLQAIARAGRGRIVVMTPDDRDLDRLLGTNLKIPWGDSARATDRSTALWRDEGPWLALLLLPLAALGFRRGWLVCIVAMALMEPPVATALDWDDLWWRADQKAARALAKGLPDAATMRAPDPAWRGAAQYRAERYQDAARSFAESPEPDGSYNRGNSLARAGALKDALGAYDAALARDPTMEDALFNRALVERLLREQKSRGQGRGQDSQPTDRSAGKDAGTEDASGGARHDDGPDRPQTGEDSARADRSGGPSHDPASEAQSGADETAADSVPPSTDASLDGADASQPPPEAGEQPSTEADALASRRGPDEERLQALEQWLRRIPDDPGGLLRRKFALEYQRRGRPVGEPYQSW